MIEAVCWGAGLRFVQALLQASPTILVGFLTAGVLRRLLGYENTRKLFGGGTWRALPQAWAIGMLLPVCSLGVIPVVRELRRAGVSGGTLLAFALTAPLFNPLSVLYGLTLADPVVILTFCFCSLVIVTVMGLAWDRLFPVCPDPSAEPPAIAYGLKRTLAVLVAAAQELAGPSVVYIVVGLCGVAALSAILPHGSLQTAAEHDDLLAPLFMTAVAVPAYATPMTAMVQLATMFQHGNSVGAAFTLLVLGAGVNLGLLAWIVRQYGWCRTVVWFALLLGVVVGLAYGVDRPVYPEGLQPAGHTHAFDVYCCPFAAGTAGAAQAAVAAIREKTPPHEVLPFLLLVAVGAAGLILARSDVRQRVEAWLERPAEHRLRWDVALPRPVLGAVALGGLVAASIFACYVYYPPPLEIHEELRLVNADLVSAVVSRDWPAVSHWLPIYDDWTRKLQVSLVLRGHPLTPYRKAKIAVLRDKLEWLEHEVADRNPEEARRRAREVNAAYLRLRAAYAEAGWEQNPVLKSVPPTP